MEHDVSVIIPAFNPDFDHLSECVDSALNQSLSPREILIVDDGSTNGLENFVTGTFGDKVTLIRQKNGGPASARNTGLSVSKGEWVAFLDSDDVWMKDKLSHQIDYALRNDFDIVITDMYKGTTPDVTMESFFSGFRVVAEGLIFDTLLNRSYIFPSTVLVRKALLEKVGGFDQGLRFMEDLDLFLRIARDHKVGVMREILVFYRTHGGNLTVSPGSLDLKFQFWMNVPARFFDLNHLQLKQVTKHVLETAFAAGYTHLKNGNKKASRTYMRKCALNGHRTFDSWVCYLKSFLPCFLLQPPRG